MAKVLMIVGLPGSGKTTHATWLMKSDKSVYKVYDDLAIHPEEYTQLKNDLRLLSPTSTVVITDAFLITSLQRSEAEAKLYKMGAVEVKWVFFENNVAQCIKNVEYRNETLCFPRNISTFYMRDLSQHYEIPVDANIISVYQKD